jgi:hypothetical protein
MEEKELEQLLEAKIRNIFSEITDDFSSYNNHPTFTLEVSKLKVTKCRINSYISTYTLGDISCCVYICCDGDYWALEDVESLRRTFKNNDELEEYINGKSLINDIKNSNVWKYCIDEEYRNTIIINHTKKELESFERNFMRILENVGAKEIMRILSPLNQFVAYGGDFEAISNFVQKISGVMAENRDLKLKQ